MKAQLLIVLAAVVVTGCGADNAIREAGPNPGDKRAVALGCFKSKGIAATLAGQKSIQITGPGAPRIDFFVSSGEAEALQFQGKAQGAEQVGPALVYVNSGTDEVLQKIEDCLAE